MLPMVVRAYWLPFREIVSVIRIFWFAFLVNGLSVALFIYGYSIHTSMPPGLPKTGFEVLFLAFAIYGIFLFFAGMVQWHRKLILNEPAQTIFIPKRHHRYYLGYTMGIFVGAILIAYVGVVGLALAFGVIVESLSLKTYLPGNELVFMGAMLVSLLLLQAFLFRRLYLNLPMVSVEKGDLEVSKKQLSVHTTNFFWVFGLFVMLFPETVILETVMYIEGSDFGIITRKHTGQFEVSELFIGLSVYFLLAFASFLSLYYRDRVRPAILGSQGAAQ